MLRIKSLCMDQILTPLITGTRPSVPSMSSQLKSRPSGLPWYARIALHNLSAQCAHPLQEFAVEQITALRKQIRNQDAKQRERVDSIKQLLKEELKAKAADEMK